MKSKIRKGAYCFGLVLSIAFVAACVGDEPSTSETNGNDAGGNDAGANDSAAPDGSGPNGCTLCVMGSATVGNCCVN